MIRFRRTSDNRALPDSRSRRQGFTLLEILVVMAVIAIILGVTWPPLMRYMGEQQLRTAVNDVRGELANARIRAIENGLVYQFRYEPGGRWFAVLPYDRPDVGNSPSDSMAGKSAFAAPTQTGPPVSLEQLPEGLLFESQPGQTTEVLPPEWVELLSKRDGLGMVAWASPILFYIDGETDNATVIVTDDRNQLQRVSVRGLTGAVSVSPLERGAAL